MKTFFERLDEMCKEQGINTLNIGKVIPGLKCGRSTVCEWKTRGANPRVETVKAIADYFGVTTAYMLGNEDSSPKASRLAGVLRLDTFTYTTCNKDLYRYMVNKLGNTINLVASTVAMLENCYTIECKVYGSMSYADVEHMVACFEKGYFSEAKE